MHRTCVNSLVVLHFFRLWGGLLWSHIFFRVRLEFLFAARGAEIVILAFVRCGNAPCRIHVHTANKVFYFCARWFHNSIVTAVHGISSIFITKTDEEKISYTLRVFTRALQAGMLGAGAA